MLCVDLWCDFMFPCGLFSSARALEAPLAAPTSLQTDQKEKFKKVARENFQPKPRFSRFEDLNLHKIHILFKFTPVWSSITSTDWFIRYSICGADGVSEKKQIECICSPCSHSSVEPPTLRGRDNAGILLFRGQSRKFLRHRIHRLQSNNWSDITKTEKHWHGVNMQSFWKLCARL